MPSSARTSGAPQAKQNRAPSGLSWPQAAHEAICEAYDGDDGDVNRRLRILIGGTTALVIAGVLVTPVVLSGGGSNGSCSTNLQYLGHPYTVRRLGGATVVQAISIGVAITRGCGSKPENVNIRSLTGVSPAVAVGLEGDQSSIYVRSGRCPRMAGAALLACVKR
jgi:hypothetical protein